MFAYDYFKDTARNISVTKDLLNSQFSWMKLFGFTKGNITRTIIKYSILLLSFLFFYLSKSMAKEIYCITDAAALQEITKNIVYEDNVPVKFV